MAAFQFNPLALLALFSGLISLALAGLAWLRRRSTGAPAFVCLMLASAVYGLANSLELSLTRLEWIWPVLCLEYAAVVLIPVGWLALVLAVTGRERWLNRSAGLAALIIPSLTLALLYTNDWHHLYYTYVGLKQAAGYTLIDLTSGPWYWVNAVYLQGCLLGGGGLLAWEARRAGGLRQRQIGWLLAGMFIPTGAHLVYLLYLAPVVQLRLDLAPLVFGVSGLIYWQALFRQRVFDLAPVARERVVESLNEAVLMLDLDDRLVDANPAARRLFGWKRLPEGLPAAELLAAWPEAVPLLRADHNQTVVVMQAGRHLEVALSLLRDERGRLLGRVLLLHDLTPPAELKQALPASHAQLSAVLDYSPAAIIVFDLEGKIQLWNAAAEKIYGWTAAEALGRTLPSVPASRERERQGFQARVNQGEIIRYVEARRQRKDGALIDISLSVAPLYDSNGQIYAQMSISADITALKQSRADLQRQAQKMAILEERARLSRNLHDSVTQSLYSLMLFADASQAALLATDPTNAQKYLARLSDTARQALKEMRLQLFELRPSALEQEGLAEALRQRLSLVEERAGVETQLELGLASDLPAALQMALYWIGQEALNNALKHASATRVTISLRMDETELVFEIADNGRGFDIATVDARAGLGIAGMRQRAYALGGALEISGPPQPGTRVRFRLPAYMLNAAQPLAPGALEGETQ